MIKFVNSDMLNDANADYRGCVLTEKKVWEIQRGDLLILKDSGLQMPVHNVDNHFGTIELEFNSARKVHSLRQLDKIRSSYILVKTGESIDRDIVFYSPRKSRIVILEKNVIYKGDI